MNNPNERTVQEWIAKRLGWTHLKIQRRGMLGEHLEGIPPNERFHINVPNWPLSFDAARELEIKDWRRFAECFVSITFKMKLERVFPPTWDGIVKMIVSTALQWCLAWILSEHGYRWVECVDCKIAREREADPDNECDHEPWVHGTKSGPNCNCSGQGGKFEKVGE